VRRLAPEAADRTATLPRFLLPNWPGVDLSTEDPRTWVEVDDPAGGDVEDFIRCARDINAQVAQLVARLDTLTA
jgi:protein-tyrosine-phosphatase